MEMVSSCKQTRNTVLAVANWLCGTLEGIAEDNTDIALAEALDSWIRAQYTKEQTLYIGAVQCQTCGKSWENFLISDMNNIQCPECGTVLNSTIKRHPRQKQLPVPNAEALNKVSSELSSIVGRISECINEIRNDTES